MAKAKARTPPAKAGGDVRVELPLGAFEGQFRANSFNEEDNTIEVVFAAGGRVKRWDWRNGEYYEEVLEMKPEAVRLDRLNKGAPFLDSHSSWSLGSIIGSVVPGSARIEGGLGVARVHLSSAPSAADAVHKIREGDAPNISVGYVQHKIQKTEADENGLPEWRVMDWEPFEISSVPIPADAGAQVRSEPKAGERMFPCIITEAVARVANTEESTTMDEETTEAVRSNDTAAAPAAPAAPVAPVAPAVSETRAAPAADNGAVARDAAAAAVRAERERTTAISETADKLNLRDLGAEHIKAGTSVEEFRKLAIDAMHHAEARALPSGMPRTGADVRVSVSDENAQKRDAAIENAILHRADPETELTADGRDYRGLSLIELARDVLEARGIRTRGMGRMEVAAAALQARSGGLISTSDFAVILSNVANKTLRKAYEAAPKTYLPLVTVTSVADFKAVTRAQLGEAPSLEKVGEHGEFKRGSIGDAGETYRVETFGKIIGLTRQTIVNDDMAALTRLPRAFGVQAASLESDLVWAEILANRPMGDGVVLFHAQHGNLGTAAALGLGPISKARTAMAKQTGLDGKTVLNIRPSFLLLPPELETDAEQFLAQITPTKTSDVVPASLRSLTPISEARLSGGIARAGIAGSATAFYLAASKAQIDLIELAYLDGQQGVYTETRQGFDVDGVELKVRLDVGAKVIDHRGLHKNAGA